MYVNATEFSPLYLQHSFMYQIKASVSQEERDTVGFDNDGDEAILGPIARYNPGTGITKTVLGYEFWGMYNEYAYDDRAQRADDARLGRALALAELHEAIKHGNALANFVCPHCQDKCACQMRRGGLSNIELHKRAGWVAVTGHNDPLCSASTIDLREFADCCVAADE